MINQIQEMNEKRDEKKGNQGRQKERKNETTNDQKNYPKKEGFKTWSFSEGQWNVMIQKANLKKSGRENDT